MTTMLYDRLGQNNGRERSIISEILSKLVRYSTFVYVFRGEYIMVNPQENE